jgi:Flp pilus assembly protein TadG
LPLFVNIVQISLLSSQISEASYLNFHRFIRKIFPQKNAGTRVAPDVHQKRTFKKSFRSKSRTPREGRAESHGSDILIAGLPKAIKKEDAMVTRLFYLTKKACEKGRTRTRFSKGQAIVEFSLILPFMLLLIGGAVDFGIAFFTSHVAQNAAREGARTAVTLTFLGENDERVSTTVKQKIPDVYLFSDFTVSNTPPAGTTCGEEVTVTIRGNYNFTVLRIMGLTSMPLSRSTTMRYEHQAVCT